MIIRSKDEADRLRLTLASLSCQTQVAEIIVVNDGSTDHTSEILSEFSHTLPAVQINHPTTKGRCAASNAGARASSGEVLIFLDGDTLAGPELVARHAQAHSDNRHLVGRGETFHLRSTRFLLDPETASPRPGEELRIQNMPNAEREALKITRHQIKTDFALIHRRAMPGIYPGAGPRALYELETNALRNHPECGVLWAATSGSNLSIPRTAFLATGGFDEALDNNEHRELGLRLCAAGSRMGLVEGALNYHMTHRTGWRDPLVEAGWEAVFYRRHPIPAVKLLSVLWASLADRSVIPQSLRLRSLIDLENAASGKTGVDYDEVRSLIPGLCRLDNAAA